MRSKIIGAILILIILLPLWMWLWWVVTPKKKINVLIVDKTVLKHPAQEHESFNWILKNKKYVKPDNTFYNVESDYLGFFPHDNKKYTINSLEGKSTRELDALSNKLDAAYFTDTYGIYDDEWYGDNSGDISRRIYGGLSKEDLYVMKEIALQKKLLLTEFNCIASPTTYDLRKEFEGLYKIRWTGWIGRYYDELDTIKNPELPRWIINVYQKNHGNWKLKGDGIVLVHINEKIEVLQNRVHLNAPASIIKTNNGNRERFSLPGKIKYSFWFEIMQTSRSNNVVSVFELNTTPAGDSILVQNNILKIFPAVIERRDSNAHMYYFAGDFADNPIKNNLAKFRGIEFFKSLSINKRNTSERESFFYDYYLPLMRTILDDYYKADGQ